MQCTHASPALGSRPRTSEHPFCNAELHDHPARGHLRCRWGTVSQNRLEASRTTAFRAAWAQLIVPDSEEEEFDVEEAAPAWTPARWMMEQDNWQQAVASARHA